MLILRDWELDEQTDWEINIYPKLTGNLYAVEQTGIDREVIGWMIKNDQET
jgi:hypothetical protein